jgi:hypothetical protein
LSDVFWYLPSFKNVFCGEFVANAMIPFATRVGGI